MIRTWFQKDAKPGEPAKPNIDYAAEIEMFVAQKKQLEMDISTVQLIGGPDPRIVIRPSREGGMKAARRIAINLTDIADANLIDSTTGDPPPNGYRQPPAHTNYRDDQKVRRYVISVAMENRLWVLRADKQWSEFNERMDTASLMFFETEAMADAYREEIRHIPGLQVNAIAA